MIEKTKDFGDKLEIFAGKALLLMCTPVFCGLAYYSARYTVLEDKGIPVDTKDNALLNLLVLLAVTAVAILLRWLARSRRLTPVRNWVATRMPYIIGVIAAGIYIFSVWWVSNCRIEPGGDGEPLCNVAHRLLLGNYVDMEWDGYMVVFPHQFSLVAVFHLIFYLFGAMNYQVFQQINAMCMPLLFISGYKILRLLCDKTEAVIYYIVLFLTCLPLLFYLPFVYGEMISITLTMVLMWQAARYCITGKKSAIFWGTLAIVLACIVRKNSFIVLVAVAVVLVVYAVRQADLKGLIWLLAMALLISGSDKLIYAHYEKVSGIEVAGGVPYISWIRMGMEDSWTGPGWFDNSSIETYTRHDYDTESTAMEEKERLKEIFQDMWADKASAIDFFRRKILTQWNEPSYSYIYETRRHSCEPWELPELIRRVYYDDEAKVKAHMNRYQFVLYCYVAASAVMLFADGKKRRCLPALLPYVAIIGGFLFTVIWEAGSRYVLPYAIYMIPLAAVGLCRLLELPEHKKKTD